MTVSEKREAARQFFQKWVNKGKEDEDDRSYWIDILTRLMAVENATDHIEFQKKVIIDGNTKRIDSYIPETKVLIEQKSLGVSLDKKILQSGGIELTPYEQAKRYNDNLPYTEKARWIVTSNFAEIWIYDMDMRVPEPTKINISDLQSKYDMLEFLVNQETVKISQEVQISKDAGIIVGKLYDAFIKQYETPDDPETLKSLNKLCVRIVFCLYAEDAGIFGIKNLFHTYMEQFSAQTARKALRDLFRILNQKEEERDKYLKDDDPILASFPYVNGGLFEDENVEIPPFTDELLHLLLDSSNFEWQNISPTIFGAVFESTLNPETRRSGGMHYTSIENIHKVIDPLFLDDLKQEFEELKNMQTRKKDGSINPIPYANKMKYLDAFQDKLASLKFLDPACGSGNFLTETYLSIRRLENAVIKEKYEYQKDAFAGQISLTDLNTMNPIKVSISHFYGIEINDFAVTVAKAALWIAESQMLEETKAIVHMNISYLPLETNAYIIEDNSLKLDWNDVVPNYELNYIMGNPPFNGARTMSKEQKAEMVNIVETESGDPKKYKNYSKNLDYVAAWYFVAARYIKGTGIQAGFVSTSSICQGEQVFPLWNTLINDMNILINFAYKPFKWESESTKSAQVFVTIIGFSDKSFALKEKRLFEGNDCKKGENISPYIMLAPTIIVKPHKDAPDGVLKIAFGNQPRDGGNLILTEEERDEILKKEPSVSKYILPYIGSLELIKGTKRYCIWLNEVPPEEIVKSKFLTERINLVREFRLSSKAKTTNQYAKVSHRFAQVAQPKNDFLAIPEVSTSKRRYIPMGFFHHDVIASNKLFIVANASLYHFGILESNVHMAWMRAVAGRFGDGYNYSKELVYNTFPWPTPTKEQKARIEKTALSILEARKRHSSVSLEVMYGENMHLFTDLRDAHNANNRAVMQAYGFSIKDMSEEDCVSELMKLYQKMEQQ